MTAMSIAGAVATSLGILIICSRAPLLLFPALGLRWFREAIKTEGRTRLLGAIVVLIALPMIWSGVSESTGLSAALSIFGVFFIVVAIPALVLFPKTYMNIAEWILPGGSSNNLWAWRIVGLIGVIIGIAVLRIGLTAL